MALELGTINRNGAHSRLVLLEAGGSACMRCVGAGGTWERDLRWEVPGAARTSTPEGLVARHDDRLVSAALVACYDELISAAKIRTGTAVSKIIQPTDPLTKLTF